ncbi:MAG: DUF6036 family nucleotidyltransferase [Bdellovibrionota bacterium]
MNEKLLTSELMILALKHLDQLLPKKVLLTVGGGGSMILAHHFPLATTDLDAIPQGMELYEFDHFIKQVSLELGIPGDWLNPYFSTFAYVLPADYKNRLVSVFNGKTLTAMALGKEDMLIMKCFAHRKKDIAHARALIKAGADTQMVEKHILHLQDKGLTAAKDAIDFLDDLLEE